MLIQILTETNEIISAEFKGYFLGFPNNPPCIGYSLEDGKISHGVLKKGHRIITLVPSLKEWHKTLNDKSLKNK